MTETFLHYLWRYRLYSKDNLRTTGGEMVEVIYQGNYNTDAGPDFLDARIKIGTTVWAGHVELHIRSSAWNNHGHAMDKTYDNVVLHVVYENDVEIRHGKGELPALELKDRFDVRLWNNFSELTASLQWVSCSHRLKEVPSFKVLNWLDTVLVERLQNKTKAVTVLVTENNFDWEESFYQRLASNFGLRINAETFLALARSLPLQHIRKQGDSLVQIEALLYGQAGMIQPKSANEYEKTLQVEYKFLRTKFKLDPIPYASWKFLRLRPPSFPTVRLAQLARLLHRHHNLFSKILETENFSALHALFEGSVSSYWKTHYRFGKESAHSEKEIGDDFFHSVLINTVVPFLFAYGKWKNEEAICEKALNLLEQIPPEDNKLIRLWSKHGMKAKHAGHTQAMLQLKTFYCEPKKCVNCGIGNYLISKA
jgi:hypothetical protein